MSIRTLVDMLRATADSAGDNLAFTFRQSDDVEQCLTFGELDHRARRFAVRLSDRMAPGSRALLVFPPGFDFLEAFFGCLYAGVIAVPLQAPPLDHLEERLDVIDLIRAETDAEAFLCDSLVGSFREQIVRIRSSLQRLWWVDASEPGCGGDDWVDPGVTEDAIAYLQFTSGSTGHPKGVVLRHRQLLANQAQISETMAFSAESVMASWLPMYHDMGLIGCVMQPIYRRFPSHLMSPLDFLSRPVRWLELVARHRATVSGAPNFAYELCARKVGPADIAALDLSSWRVAFCGAEPVKPDTMRRFARQFAPAGFDASALFPCYGLAEAALLVTGVEVGGGHHARTLDRAARRKGATVPAVENGDRIEVSSSGRPATGNRIVVVDPAAGHRLPDGCEGEIWLRGPSVAGGYWRNQDASEATFVASLEGEVGPWLRTGDLGVVLEGELYVTGRLKEVLIVRGRNVHPHDVEAAVQAADTRFRPGCGAVFAIEDDERVVLVQETTETDPGALADLVRVARRAASRSAGIDLEEVVLVAARTVPKTSSGKVRRRRCMELLLKDEIEALTRHRKRLADPSSTRPGVDGEVLL